MKKFKLLALAFVIGSASLFASNIEAPETVKKEIRSQIVQLLETPEFAIQNELSILVNFTFNSKGEIVVLSVNSKNSDVLNYIRKNLNGKQIENPGERGKSFTMNLRIKEI